MRVVYTQIRYFLEFKNLQDIPRLYVIFFIEKILWNKTIIAEKLAIELLSRIKTFSRNNFKV